MASTPDGGAGVEDHSTAGDALPAFVDWLLGAIVALGGLLSIVGAGALAVLVDRNELEAGIEEGTVTVTVPTTELTAAEQLEVIDTVISWTSLGLLVTGVGMVLFAIGYVVVRHRAHRRAEAHAPVGSYSTSAVLGAVVTAVFSFIPVSPAIGGALSGYLERGASDRTITVGALGGVLPVVPVSVILVFVLGGLGAGLLAIREAGMAMVLVASLVLVVLLIAALSAGLGALGGYVGGRLAASRTRPD